jgi:hypothetical protein
MRRSCLSILAGAALSVVAVPALAGSSLLGDGSANWFYACADGMAMNLVIAHEDGTFTLFSLHPGERDRTAVRQGDRVAWRCGGPVTPGAAFIAIVTVP